MSRPSAAPSGAGRSLTLTEELERLEQSITLTLQEIDSNFSKAHRIVTTSILPLVEQYGEHSKAVWEASKFWKQFFEASANVSLSGYEELAEADGDTTARAADQDDTNAGGAEDTALEDSTAMDYTATDPADEAATTDNKDGEHSEYLDPSHHGGDGGDDDDQDNKMDVVEESLLAGDDDADEMSGSTPRLPATRSLQPQLADFGSPYEKLRQELKRGNTRHDDNDTVRSDLFNSLGPAGPDNMTLDVPSGAPAPARPSAPGARLPDMSMTPRGRPLDSSILPREPTLTTTAAGSAARGKNNDPLLHRLLDKNYRLQATPLKGQGGDGLGSSRRISPHKTTTPGNAGDDDDNEDRTRRALWADSPMSSPEIAAPKLRSDLYMSPVKLRQQQQRQRGGAAGGPRTPGVSVQTPGAGTARKTRDVFAGDDSSSMKGKGKAVQDEITWESDSDKGHRYDDDDDDGTDAFGGMSPPKTIQFALPPSKLMQTPANEASKRIVQDVLLTAGLAPDDSEEYSPTMVKMNKDVLDDTF